MACLLAEWFFMVRIMKTQQREVEDQMERKFKKFQNVHRVSHVQTYPGCQLVFLLHTSIFLVISFSFLKNTLFVFVFFSKETCGVLSTPSASIKTVNSCLFCSHYWSDFNFLVLKLSSIHVLSLGSFPLIIYNHSLLKLEQNDVQIHKTGTLFEKN